MPNFGIFTFHPGLCGRTGNYSKIFLSPEVVSEGGANGWRGMLLLSPRRAIGEAGAAFCDITKGQLPETYSLA